MTGVFALIRFVAARHLIAGKLRSFLTLFGVALGVAMVVGTTAANDSVLKAFDELSDRAAGKADLEIVADESGVDQRVVEELADRHDLAEHVAGRIEQTTLVYETNGQPGPRVLVLGIDFLGDLAFVPFVKNEGADPFADALAFVNDPHAILVSETLARERGLKPGSTISLRTAHGVEEFHVEALLKETGSSRAFGGQVVVLGLDAAQLAFAREGKVDRVDLQFPPNTAYETGRANVQALLGMRAKADRPSQRAKSLARMTAAFQGGLSVTAIIAVLVGVFLVYNAIGVAVSQRRREIGTLRSIGASRRAVVGTFLGEALFLGLFGGVIGVLMGGALAKSVIGQFGANVSRFFENIAPPPVHVDRALAIKGVALGVVASLLAAWGPARRAASVAPIESVRTTADVASRAYARRKPLAVVALVLSIAAAFVVRKPTATTGLIALLCIFLAAIAVAPFAISLLSTILAPLAQSTIGISARLGVDGVARALGRSTQTVGALTLATALGLTIATYTHSYEKTCMAWVEQTVPADIVVSAGSPLPDRYVIAFDPKTKDPIEKVEGVAAVNMVRAISVPYGQLRVEVLSVETEVYLARRSEERHVVRGPRKVPIDALSKEPAILISENFSWKTGLGPGDFVELSSPTGPHKFRIVAVVVDYSNDQGWMVIDRKWSLEYWQDPRVELLHVYLRPGVDPLVAADNIRRALGNAGVFVTTNAALKAEIRKVIEQTFGIASAAETIALIVAVLGVIGTMIATVIDRRRELGVLRAIGGTRRQIVVSVMTEAAMLGACAAVLAILASIPASKIFVDVVAFQASGWSVPLIFPWLTYLRVGALVTALAALAGLIPGVRASRVVITRALAHE
jgi:putative ABC transport system permease protein